MSGEKQYKTGDTVFWLEGGYHCAVVCGGIIRRTWTDSMCGETRHEIEPLFEMLGGNQNVYSYALSDSPEEVFEKIMRRLRKSGAVKFWKAIP